MSRFGSLHVVDLAVIVLYLALVLYFGKRRAKGNDNEEGFFLANRSLGKFYQFFLNLGQSTDAQGAVSTASIVYQQGVSGVWLSLQTIFMNPYYWFMNLWFRRVRLITMADLFEDRLGSRSLARLYAIFQIVATVVVFNGFSNLIAYKISASLAVKPEAEWTVAERQSVADYRELKHLEQQAKTGPLTAADQARRSVLHEAEARREVHSYITILEPWVFYLCYTALVAVYMVLGGMGATVLNEALQGTLIVIFSAIMIPAGLVAVGGWQGLAAKVPSTMFDLLGHASSHITSWTLIAILFVSLIQIHANLANMGVSGSAKNEYAARFGAVAGTYAKRIMVIMWAFVGLIALALFQGPGALSDPDAVWGAMARQLLGPGFLGLMLAAVIASTSGAQTMAASALFVRNIYRHFRPNLSHREAVTAGRWAVIAFLGLGAISATTMTNAFSVAQLLLVMNVPFGASILLMFVWRRLTGAAVWCAVIVSALVTLVAPFVAPLAPAIAQHPALVARETPSASGRQEPLFFEIVVRSRPDDPTSPLEGRGRCHVELYLLHLAGVDIAGKPAGERFAARFFFDGFLPFVFLLLVSVFTRPPPAALVDRFYGKMKTTVGATPELEAAAIAETLRNPRRLDHKKLFRNSNWEFTRWDRVDAIGFVACCAISGTILAAFVALLRTAA